MAGVAAVAAMVVLLVVSCRMIDAAAVRLTEPRRYELGRDARALADHPEAAGLKVRKLTVATTDGLRLPVWVIDPLPGSKAWHERRAELVRDGVALKDESAAPVGTVLMFHGINSRKEHMLWAAQWLAAAGYRCVAWDSRGHGESPVATASFGVREVADTEAVYQLLRDQHLLTGPVRVYGHSMGAAVAVQWLPQHPEVGAVVLCAPFARLSEVMKFQAETRGSMWMKPLVPLVRQRVASRAHYDPYGISPVEVMPRVKAPVLIFHGRDDVVVPPEQSVKLLRACRNPASRRVVTPGGHNNPLSCLGTTGYADMVRFFGGGSER